MSTTDSRRIALHAPAVSGSKAARGNTESATIAMRLQEYVWFGVIGSLDVLVYKLRHLEHIHLGAAAKDRFQLIVGLDHSLIFLVL
jgi:hypothetical protein